MIQTTTKSGMSPTRRPEQVADIYEYEIDDEIVLFDPRGDAVHTLNPTAVTIWWLCDGDHAVDAITRELADLYELHPRDVRRDVGEILRRFQDSGLIRWK